MKAVVVEKPGDENALKLAEVPEPSIKPDEILIRVRAAGLNRADILQRQGFYPPPPGASEIIGMEVAGEVVAVGASVKGWKVGDRDRKSTRLNSSHQIISDAVFCLQKKNHKY